MQLKNQLPNNCHVVLSISIGQSTQTGENFSHIIDLILEQKAIKKITIFKADILQRFNIVLREDITEEEAEAKSRADSEVWDNENKKSIDKLREAFHAVGKTLQVKTWDEYRLSDKFKDTQAQMEKLYTEDNKFKHHVDGIAKNFVHKLKTEIAHEKYEYEKSFNSYKKYCLEGCTVLLLMSKDDNEAYNVELYKGERNRAMSYVHKKFVLPGRMVSNPVLDKKITQTNLTENAASFFNNNEKLKVHIKFDVNQDTSISVEVKSQVLDDRAISTISKILTAIKENNNEDINERSLSAASSETIKFN